MWVMKTTVSVNKNQVYTGQSIMIKVIRALIGLKVKGIVFMRLNQEKILKII